MPRFEAFPEKRSGWLRVWTAGRGQQFDAHDCEHRIATCRMPGWFRACGLHLLGYGDWTGPGSAHTHRRRTHRPRRCRKSPQTETRPQPRSMWDNRTVLGFATKTGKTLRHHSRNPANYAAQDHGPSPTKAEPTSCSGGGCCCSGGGPLFSSSSWWGLRQVHAAAIFVAVERIGFGPERISSTAAACSAR